ncbi:MAG: serine protein kinase RIO [Promethearchaeota archaeon]
MEEKEIDNLYIKKVDKRKKRIKDSSDFIHHDATIDLRTRKILFKMMNRRIISEFVGIISTGKEANVYSGIDGNQNEIAIKIYRINAQTSKWMMRYISGDPRFKNFRRGNARLLISTWAFKEFKNLRRSVDAGVNSPRPIFVRENVLVMHFIGRDGTPAQKLVNLEIPNKRYYLNKILTDIQRLFVKAELVHGDLSPYNLLYHENEVYFIDFAQSVLKDHPMAMYYLERDLDNVLAYFSNILPESFDKNALFNDIIKGNEIEI